MRFGFAICGMIGVALQCVCLAQVGIWDKRFGLPGVGSSSSLTDDVRVIAPVGGTIYVGGSFSEAGGINCKSVAAWRSNTWSALGGGVSGVVDCIIPYQSKLLFGGNFTIPNLPAATNLAVWDGNQWMAFDRGAPSGAFDEIFSMTVVGSTLYIGGNFTGPPGVNAKGIMSWNGSNWQNVGGGVTSGANPGTIQTLYAVNGKLYAGGSFNMAGKTAATNLAVWDGLKWDSVVGGVNGQVRALVQYSDGLIVGGVFSSAGNVPATNLAILSNGEWRQFAGGISNERSGVGVTSIASDGLHLIVGGYLTNAGESAISGIAMWNGIKWDTMDGGVHWGGTELGVPKCVSTDGGVFYVGGGFFSAGSQALLRIGKWESNKWSTMAAGAGGKGLSGNYSGVSALSQIGNDLLLAGSFWTIGDQAKTNDDILLSRWNGTNWSILSRGNTDGDITSLIVDGELVIAGGTFTNIDGVTAHQVAAFQSNRWTALGAGFDKVIEVVPPSSANVPKVEALAVAGNLLYAVGHFLMSGSNVVRHIAKWDGQDWTSVGGGVQKVDSKGNETSATRVYSLAFDRSSNLIVGGTFNVAGAVLVTNIAKWNGSTWTSLGNGLNGVVYTVAESGGFIYAGGTFQSSGPKLPASLNCIARWDGQQWEPLARIFHS